MMRDQLKSERYFLEYIEEDSGRIRNFQERLERHEVAPDRVLPVQRKIHDLKLGILIAEYSRGDAPARLKEDYLLLLDGMQQVWDPDYYIKNLWMIALGVLFNAGQRLEGMRRLAEDSGIKDWLYDFLLYGGDMGSRIPEEKLMFPKAYGKLKDMAQAGGGQRSALLEEYINKIWYKAHRDCGWYDSHKSRERIYNGYWSFEGAAVARLLEVNDEGLKDAPCYPYDLAHFQDNK